MKSNFYLLQYPIAERNSRKTQEPKNTFSAFLVNSYLVLA